MAFDKKWAIPIPATVWAADEHGYHMDNDKARVSAPEGTELFSPASGVVDFSNGDIVISETEPGQGVVRIWTLKNYNLPKGKGVPSNLLAGELVGTTSGKNFLLGLAVLGKDANGNVGLLAQDPVAFLKAATDTGQAGFVKGVAEVAQALAAAPAAAAAGAPAVVVPTNPPSSGLDVYNGGGTITVSKGKLLLAGVGIVGGTALLAWFLMPKKRGKK